MPNSRRIRKKRCSNCTRNQKKNVRSMRGVPENNYGEVKKVSSFSLTPTAVNLLKDTSRDLNISTSELLERFARLGAELKDSLRQELVQAKALTEST
ncbi:MAG: hypothetical protein SFY66_26575 [Oculatellaceae cyanobacterium bins.114]|nr:hypothetical protein [Oculatellaceae cyanobacterium bins.114]